MRYSALTQRIAGEGAAAWQIHDRALELRAEGVDVLLLGVGDPDFDTPLPIVHGAIDSLLAGDTHYADVRGRFELRRLIAERTAPRPGQGIVIGVLGTDSARIVAGGSGASAAVGGN